MENGKVIFKSKTFWAAISTIALGIGAFLSGEHQLQELIVIVIGAVFGILRLITNEKIITKQ